MTTEDSPPVKAEQSHAKQQGLSGWDVAGIVLGGIMALPAVPFTLSSIRGSVSGFPDPGFSLACTGIGSIWLLICVGLMIPGKNYGRGALRAFGFGTLALMAGGSIALPVLAVIFGKEGYAHINSVDGMGPMMFAVLCVVAAGFLVPSTVVSLKKLQRKRSKRP